MPRPNVYLTAAELIDLGMCPFRDERFAIDLSEPCPVCGMLDDDNEDRCVGDGSKLKNKSALG